MVIPVQTPPGPNQSTTSMPRTPEKPGVLDGLSLGDAQVLRRVSGREFRREPGSDGQKQAAGAASRQAGGSASSARRKSMQGRSGSQLAAIHGLRHADRNLTRSVDDFAIRPIAAGARVLISEDGKVLFNLKGPLAAELTARLSAALPRNERPTVWLGEAYGHISIASIQEYLDLAVRPEDGNAIVLRLDGAIFLCQDPADAAQDDIIIAERAAAPGNIMSRMS